MFKKGENPFAGGKAGKEDRGKGKRKKGKRKMMGRR